MENQITVCENKAYVVGKLKEKKINFLSKDGKLMANGYLVVLTRTKYGVGEVRVSVLQNAITAEGKENSLYKALVTISNEYKSIVETGSEETADLIRVEGELVDETYYSPKKGDFIEKIGIKGTFINRISRTDKTGKEIEDRSRVALEGYISEVVPVEEELKVTFISVGYKGAAIPVVGFVPKDLVIPFQNRHAVGQTTTLNFDIVNSVEIEEVQKEVGFGEALGETIQKETSKNLIIGGGAINYNGYTPEDIKQSLARRETILDSKRERALKKSNENSFTAPVNNISQQGTQSGGMGFGANPTVNNTMPTGTMNFNMPQNVGNFSMPNMNIGQ